MAESNQAPEHPAASSLSRNAYARMHRDPRFTTGAWSESDWLWEEVRQLNAVILMASQALDASVALNKAQPAQQGNAQ